MNNNNNNISNNNNLPLPNPTTIQSMQYRQQPQQVLPNPQYQQTQILNNTTSNQQIPIYQNTNYIQPHQLTQPQGSYPVNYNQIHQQQQINQQYQQPQVSQQQNYYMMPTNAQKYGINTSTDHLKSYQTLQSDPSLQKYSYMAPISVNPQQQQANYNIKRNIDTNANNMALSSASLPVAKKSRPSNVQSINESKPPYYAIPNEVMTLPKKIESSINDINSNQLQVIIRGLNFFIQKSYELSDNNAIQLDHYPNILVSFGKLLNIINPLGNLLFDLSNISDSSEYLNIINDKSKIISLDNPISRKFDYQLIGRMIDDNQMLIIILNILRNFIADIVNEQPIANNIIILKHILSILYTTIIPKHYHHNSNTLSECAIISFDIMISIASKIDIRGKKRLNYNIFLENSITMKEYEKNILKFHLLDNELDKSTNEYIYIVLTIIPFIYQCMLQTKSRNLLIKALELLHKLVYNNDNITLFLRLPDIFYDKLIELLCISYTLVEPLPMSSDNEPIRHRYNRIPLSIGLIYYPDVCDHDIKDIIIDCLLLLCQQSIKLQIKLCNKEMLLKILLDISSLKKLKFRNDSMNKAFQLIGLLANRIENKNKFKCIYIQMLSLGLTDETMADITLHQVTSLINDKSNPTTALTIIDSIMNI